MRGSVLLCKIRNCQRDAVLFGLDRKDLSGFPAATRCSSDQRDYPKVRLTDAGEDTSVLGGILTSRMLPEVGRKAPGTMARLNRRQRHPASETASANTLMGASSPFPEERDLKSSRMSGSGHAETFLATRP